MGFIRKVVNGTDLQNAIEIPSYLVNKKVEVLIFPFEEKVKNKKNKKSLSGFLSKYANKELIKEEENVWYKEAKE